jgi:hypothetical protein
MSFIISDTVRDFQMANAFRRLDLNVEPMEVDEVVPDPEPMEVDPDPATEQAVGSGGDRPTITVVIKVVVDS